MGTLPGTEVMRGIERWSRRDPIWWRRGVIDIATMRIGDHQRCVLAQGYALRAEPSPGDPSGEPCLRAISNVYSNRIVGHSMKAGPGGFDCRSGGQLCEVGGGSPVNLRYRVGAVPEGGIPATAMAKASGSIAKVKPGGEQLAGRIVPQNSAADL